MYRVPHVKEFSRLFLRGYAGFLDKIDISSRAAVADRRFICVHFNNGVVYAHRPQRAQHVLDCVDAHGAFAYRCGALNCFQVRDVCVDGRLVLQILTPELNSVIRRRGMEFKRDLFACVQRCAAQTGGLANGLLKFRRDRHRRLTNRDFRS